MGMVVPPSLLFIWLFLKICDKLFQKKAGKDQYHESRAQLSPIYRHSQGRSRDPSGTSHANYNEKTLRLITQMHKAITIIQFKLEAEIINRRPEFDNFE